MVSEEVEPEVKSLVILGPEVKILDHVSTHVIMKIHVKFSLLLHVLLKPWKQIPMDAIDKQEQIF